MVWPFTRKLKVQETPPEDLQELHTFTEPTEWYPSAQPAGSPTYATPVGEPLRNVKAQDRMLVHWDRPPDGENPERWYEDRDSDKRHRLSVEEVNGTAFHGLTGRKFNSADPRWNPGAPDRLTSELIPTNGYVFTRPYDQDIERELNGDHFSMADNLRAFSVGGMNPVRKGRNTYRLTPPPLDATSVDLDTVATPGTVNATYVSPESFGGRTYRLGG